MSIHTDGPMFGPWKFHKSLQGGYFLEGAVGHPGGFEIILATEDIRQADAAFVESAPDMFEALEEIKMDRLIELQTGLISVWRKAGGVK